MSIFQIKQKTNGAVLWTGSATDAEGEIVLEFPFTEAITGA